MNTIWANARKKRTWKIVGSATAALIFLLSLVGIVSKGLGGLILVVSVIFGFRAGCRQLRKLFKRWRGTKSMVDYKKDERVVSKLLPDEIVIVATPEHPVAIVMSIFSFATLIAVAIGAAVGAYASARGHAIQPGGHIQIAPATVIVGMVLGLIGRMFYRILVWRTDLLVLTNKRLYTVAGFFSREREAIRLKGIAGIKSKTRGIAYIAAWLGLIDEPIGYVVATGIGTIFERFRHTPKIEEFTRKLEIAQDQA